MTVNKKNQLQQYYIGHKLEYYTLQPLNLNLSHVVELAHCQLFVKIIETT